MIRVSLSGLGASNANPLRGAPVPAALSTVAGGKVGAGVGTTGLAAPGASGSFGAGAAVPAGVGWAAAGAGVVGAGVVGAGVPGWAAPGFGCAPPTGTHLPSISTFRPPSSPGGAGCAGSCITTR